MYSSYSIVFSDCSDRTRIRMSIIPEKVDSPSTIDTIFRPLHDDIFHSSYELDRSIIRHTSYIYRVFLVAIDEFPEFELESDRISSIPIERCEIDTLSSLVHSHIIDIADVVTDIAYRSQYGTG